MSNKGNILTITQTNHIVRKRELFGILEFGWIPIFCRQNKLILNNYSLNNKNNMTLIDDANQTLVYYKQYSPKKFKTN